MHIPPIGLELLILIRLTDSFIRALLVYATKVNTPYAFYLH